MAPPAGLVHESGADLLVLGSSQPREGGQHAHRARWAAGSLFGSPCTVAVAPKGFRHDRSRPAARSAIAFEAADEALHAVEEGARLAQSLGARACGSSASCHRVAPWALGGRHGRRDTPAGDVREPPPRDLRARPRQRPRRRPRRRAGRGPPGRGPARPRRSRPRLGRERTCWCWPPRASGPCPGVRPGATAAAIMRACPCPVLLTPTGTRDTGSPAHAAASG